MADPQNSSSNDNSILDIDSIEIRKSLIGSLYDSYNAIVDKDGDINDLQKAADTIHAVQNIAFEDYSKAIDDLLKPENDGTKKNFADFKEKVDDVFEYVGLCTQSSASLNLYEENSKKYESSLETGNQFVNKNVSSIVDFVEKIDKSIISHTDYGENAFDQSDNYKNYGINSLINHVFKSPDEIGDLSHFSPLYDDIVIEHAKNNLSKDTSILDEDVYQIRNAFETVSKSEKHNFSEIEKILNNNYNEGVFSSENLKTLFEESINSPDSKKDILDDFAIFSSSYHKNDSDSSALEKDLYEMCKESATAGKHSYISDAVGSLISGNRNDFNKSDLSKFYGEVTIEEKGPLLSISKNLFKETILDSDHDFDKKPQETCVYLYSITTKGIVKDDALSSEIKYVSETISSSLGNNSKETSIFLKTTTDSYIKKTETNGTYNQNVVRGLLEEIGDLNVTSEGVKFTSNDKLLLLRDVRESSFESHPEKEKNLRMVEDVIRKVVFDAEDLTVDEKVNTLSNYIKSFEEGNENIPKYQKSIIDLLSKTSNDKESIVANVKSLDGLINTENPLEEYVNTFKQLLENDKMTSEEVVELLKECKSDTAKEILNDKVKQIDKANLEAPLAFSFESSTPDGKKIINSISLNAGNWYERILKYKFEGSNIIDVISDYGWTNNNIYSHYDGNLYSKLNNIPYCFVTEYQQLYNASINNILTSLVGLQGSVSHLIDNTSDVFSNITSQFGNIGKKLLGGSLDAFKSTTIGENVSNAASQAADAASETSNTIKEVGTEAYNWLKEHLKGIVGNVFNLGLNNGPINPSAFASELLNPYRLMYIVKPTEKKYCFPMLDKSASSFRVNNKMEEKDEGVGSILLGNKLTSVLGVFTKHTMGLAQDMANIAPFLDPQKGATSSQIKQYNIERSKYFTYPTDGEDVEINFVLFNSVRPDIWKKHYRLILGFVLRNLPFKQDVVSYYPPLFYDIYIPGVKRCPFCYVETVNVTPLGLMRTLKLPGEQLHFDESAKIDKHSEFSINVPEAWNVTIKFKSLLGTSANQILSGLLNAPNQIMGDTASSSNSNLK